MILTLTLFSFIFLIEILLLMTYQLIVLRKRSDLFNKWADEVVENITSLQKKLNTLYSNQKALSDSIRKVYAEIYRGKKKQKGIKEVPRNAEESGTV
jgi:uncharacterized coiled-coil DUF342 family protein